MTNPDKRLNINQNIELIIKEGSHQGSYNSKVYDMNKKQIMVMPIYKKERLIPLKRGLEVEILYEGDNAFYSLKTEIIGEVRNDVLMIALKNTGEIERIQRRSYFRLKVNKKIKYAILNKDNKENGQLEFTETNLIDLSGGGLQMVLKDDLNIKDKLLIDLNLDDLDKLIKAEIVRIKYNKEGYSKTAGLEFKELDRKSRDQIISFLFNYQRKLRRRGMM